MERDDTVCIVTLDSDGVDLGRVVIRNSCMVVLVMSMTGSIQRVLPVCFGQHLIPKSCSLFAASLDLIKISISKIEENS